MTAMTIDQAHRDSGWDPECPSAHQGSSGNHDFTDWALYVLGKDHIQNFHSDGKVTAIRADVLVTARCCKVCGLTETKL
jgi:hypothetical protein